MPIVVNLDRPDGSIAGFILLPRISGMKVDIDVSYSSLEIMLDGGSLKFTEETKVIELWVECLDNALYQIYPSQIPARDRQKQN